MRKILKSLKLVLVIGIAATMVLAGCSKNSSSSESGDNSGEPYEINMLFPINGTEQGLEEVVSEINKITKEKINATVNIKTTSWAAWTQQSNLALVGGDKLDIIMTLSSTLGTQVSKGFLLPLDELLESNGQGVVDAMDPDYLKAASVDGKVYALPSIRDMAASYGFMMRQDILDKYKIDVTTVKTLDEVEAVFKTIKENEPGMTPLVMDGTNSPLTRFMPGMYDSLGDGIGVLPDFDNDMKVVNWFETEEYKELLDTMRKWYLAGYIVKDAATNQKPAATFVKADTGFSWEANLKPGADRQESVITSKPMTSAEILPPVMTTSQVTAINFSIAKNSENPEKAMEFLNLLYTDKDIINLFDWGVEGKHYVKTSENVIDYPEGTDPAKPPYGINQGWMFGNQLLSYTFNGEDPDIYKKLEEFNKNAVRSKALGFTYNPEPVKTELAAINNVVTEYQRGLETGTLDPEENLPKFIKALKDAGIDKVIEEKQNQLDEWVKNN
ncbi:ABC transporter substrate-binding protein [Metabacillus bambusae]|uniref:ABC transporter substrate-binding protein n=1 Tax=Metabacillus bambusae TaxID=2795218 RepID=A0ABS3MX74_9BACI|nr:ABC transporter substrate-binding protein [Metabacillus bambusae]MBO1510622.1 ABC transporter substrate-binding protein [Metabacillus bambusae]